LLHDRDAFERLGRPDEKAGSDPGISLATFSMYELP
jgi:hypothetical protein